MLDILIVEDELYTQSAIEKILLDSELPCKVIGKAFDGQEAIAAIKEQKPQLVLTDIRMPRMDGLDLAQFIFTYDPMISVVIISGYSDFSYAQQGIRYRVFDYLLKPIKRAQLVEVVAKVIDLRQRPNLSLRKTWAPNVMAIVQDLLESLQLTDGEKVVQATTKLWDDLVVQHKLDGTQQRDVANNLLAIVEDQFGIGESLKVSDNVFEQLQQKLGLIIEQVREERKGLGNNLLQRVVSYVDEHYSEEINLHNVAELVYLNPGYFSEKFKELTGENFSVFVTRVRVDKAKELLHDERNKVYEVAYQVGYQDHAYFSRVFKRCVGVSPAEYRRRLGIV